MANLLIFKEFVNVFRSYVAKHGFPDNVVYPFCGPDKSPSVVFPKDAVLYLDNDPDIVKSLVDLGLEARCVDVENIDQMGADLLILFSPPSLDLAAVLSRIKAYHVICDNSEGTAYRLHRIYARERKKFQLLEVLDEESLAADTCPDLFRKEGFYLFHNLSAEPADLVRSP